MPCHLPRPVLHHWAAPQKPPEIVLFYGMTCYWLTLEKLYWQKTSLPLGQSVRWLNDLLDKYKVFNIKKPEKSLLPGCWKQIPGRDPARSRAVPLVSGRRMETWSSSQQSDRTGEKCHFPDIKGSISSTYILSSERSKQTDSILMFVSIFRAHF